MMLISSHFQFISVLIANLIKCIADLGCWCLKKVFKVWRLVYSGKCTQLIQLVCKHSSQILRNKNRIKNPNWQEATSWLFTNMAEDLNTGQPRTNPSSRQSGIQTQGCLIASPTRLTTQPRCLLVFNPLSLNSDQQQFSPNYIHTLSWD